MGFIFDQNTANRHERWFRTDQGRTAFNLQTELALRLIQPRPGERLLDVGCGSGGFLLACKQAGLSVTGLEPSEVMFRMARDRAASKAHLFKGRAEDLPFEDNEFDVVSFITSLEFIDDPELALAEAVRVSRNRLFLGVLNRWSLTSIYRRCQGLFKESIYNRAAFYSLWDLENMVSPYIGSNRIRWGTVPHLSPKLSRRFEFLHSRQVSAINPLGAFLGVTAYLDASMRVEGLPLLVRMGLKGTDTSPSTASTAIKNKLIMGKGSTNQWNIHERSNPF